MVHLIGVEYFARTQGRLVQLLLLLFGLGLSSRVLDPQQSTNSFADLKKELVEFRETFDDWTTRFVDSLLLSRGNPESRRKKGKKKATPTRPEGKEKDAVGMAGEYEDPAPQNSSRNEVMVPMALLAPLSRGSSQHLVADGSADDSKKASVTRDRGLVDVGDSRRGWGSLPNVEYQPGIVEGVLGAEGAAGPNEQSDVSMSFENEVKSGEDNVDGRVAVNRDDLGDLQLEVATLREEEANASGDEEAAEHIASSTTQKPISYLGPAPCQSDGQFSLSRGVSPPSVDAPKFNSAALQFEGNYYNNPATFCGLPFYIGTLNFFNFQNGYGFLECKETFEIYKTDVYIHESQLPTPWQLGQLFKFRVRTNRYKKPQATDVTRFHMPAQKLEDDAKRRIRNAALFQRHMGMLKSFSAVNGYGFIASEDVAQKRSCDVYLDHRQLPECGSAAIGRVIEFDIEDNKNGQPQARNVNWSPVSFLRRVGPGALARSVGGAIDYNELTRLDLILGLLRAEDTSGAIKVALELQETSDRIDYISFALKHLGEPSPTIVAGLSTVPPSVLLISLSNLLAAASLRLEGGCAAAAVGWCVAILESNDSVQAENVANVVQKSIEIASTLEAYSSEPTLFQCLLEKLSKISTPE